LNPRDTVIRRGLFWLAMTAGVALVASQFACDRPRSIPSAEHRSVDRLPLVPQETLKVVQPDTTTPVGWWVRPQRTAKAEIATTAAPAKSKASGSASPALQGE